MAGAAYEATGSLTDDESFGFTLKIQEQDGTALPLADYAFEYSLVGCGVSLTLNEASGIIVDVPNEVVIVETAPDYRLPRGQYEHGLRLTHLVSNKTVQLFDGTVTVTEGHFS